MTQAADTIFFGGPILTIDPSQPQVQALAVRNGRILALGDLQAVEAEADAQTTRVNLAGQTLLPGFVEAHAHPFGYGRIWGEPLVNIRASHIPSYEAVLATIRRKISKSKPGEVLAFVGLDALRHEGMREPSLAELDALAPDNPIAVYTFNFHSLFLNTKMMGLLGLDENTADYPGGRHDRDAKGRLTGKVVEFAAFSNFERICQMFGSDRGQRELAGGLWKFAHSGITTAADLGLHDGAVAAYKFLYEKNQLPLRLRLYGRGSLETEALKQFDWGKDFVQMCGIKVWADGSPFVGTAWLSRPYLTTDITVKGMALPPGYCGHMNYSSDKLYELVEHLAGKGWQIATHVQGDQTMDTVLDVFEKVLKKHPQPNMPHRIEHCGTVRDEQLVRANDLGLVCSFFVPHVYHWGDPIQDALLGPERAGNYMPVGSATRLNMRLSYHSDAPMTEPDPLLSIQTAVTRRTASGTVIGEHQRVTIDQALRAMTIDAAYQIGMDKDVGSLEIGKCADFVVLSENPRDVAPETIAAIAVRGTWIDGRPVRQHT
jgi:predicted amidohydrolase YtcJ